MKHLFFVAYFTMSFSSLSVCVMPDKLMGVETDVDGYNLTKEIAQGLKEQEFALDRSPDEERMRLVTDIGRKMQELYASMDYVPWFKIHESFYGDTFILSRMICLAIAFLYRNDKIPLGYVCGHEE